jgi:hypothetical protein
VDYVSLPLSATFAANQTTVDVAVTPIADGVAEGSETVVLTLVSAAGYGLGSPTTASVELIDSPGALVTVRAPDAAADESGDTARFVVSRSGSTALPLTVTIRLTGTAQNGVDYDSLSTTVTFGANVSAVTLFVNPLSDTANDPSETVILEVVDGFGYDPGGVWTATVTITGT